MLLLFLFFCIFDILIKTLKNKKQKRPPLGENSSNHWFSLSLLKKKEKKKKVIWPLSLEKSKSEIINFSFNIKSNLYYCSLALLHYNLPSKAPSKEEKKVTYLSRCSSACDEKSPFLNL